jgi:hypothetical protein
MTTKDAYTLSPERWTMTRFVASSSFAFVFLVTSAFCQMGSTSYSSGPTGGHGSMTIGRPYSLGTGITGAPYSAEELDESVQTLADGTHIRHSMPGAKTYRDSMGRTRTERQPFRNGRSGVRNEPASPIVVEIDDPAGHVRYVFDLDDPVAHRQEMPGDEARGDSPEARVIQPLIGASTGATGTAFKGVSGTAPAARCPDTAPAAKPRRDDDKFPHTTSEDLGTQIIEGIPADGRRQTTVWPVDSIGNDRPITTTSETWFSPDIKQIILSKSDDPRSGEHTHKLMDVSRAEPDPSLFEPPPGYTVKDEKGEFTINWTTPPQRANQ